jgi:hypothetical protein
MTDSTCQYYERDDAAFQEYIEMERHFAAETPRQYPGEEPDSPCQGFCKHFASHNGFPGETLYCCEHPDNRKILECESVFDGVDNYAERLRILDEIV